MPNGMKNDAVLVHDTYQDVNENPCCGEAYPRAFDLGGSSLRHLIL